VGDQSIWLSKLGYDSFIVVTNCTTGLESKHQTKFRLVDPNVFNFSFTPETLHFDIGASPTFLDFWGLGRGNND